MEAAMTSCSKFAMVTSIMGMMVHGGAAPERRLKSWAFGGHPRSTLGRRSTCGQPPPGQRMTSSTSSPALHIGVVMGSSSDWDTMQHAVQILEQFGVAHEARVVSAHRMPDQLFAYAEAAQGRGLQAIIAGAGGAAHLPGMLAAKTCVPVLGVPVASRHLQGVDSLHSIVQMPKGIPVATFAIGNAGAANAALFAVAMLALHNPALAQQLQAFRAEQTRAAQAMTLPPAAA
jgi:5-(carboxyamino)imidazole ribonucleotide mutase